MKKLDKMCAHARRSITLHLDDVTIALERLKTATSANDPSVADVLHEISTIGYHLTSVSDMAINRVRAEQTATNFSDFLSGLEAELGIVVTPSDLKMN